MTVRELFARVREGDFVFVATPEARTIPDPNGGGRFHYAGLGGAGMSALAQFQVMTGGVASGSDRAFDRGEREGLRAQLERLGITVMPQDGSGLGPDCAALVVSTAVEEHVPDFAAARAKNIPIIHRSELLAHFVARHRSIAVTGTSGKSTVTAMVFAILKRRRPRPLGHHRGRSAGASGARPAGQCLGRTTPTCSWSKPTRATARSSATRRPSA